MRQIGMLVGMALFSASAIAAPDFKCRAKVPGGSTYGVEPLVLHGEQLATSQPKKHLIHGHTVLVVARLGDRIESQSNLQIKIDNTFSSTYFNGDSNGPFNLTVQNGVTVECYFDR